MSYSRVGIKGAGRPPAKRKKKLPRSKVRRRVKRKTRSDAGMSRGHQQTGRRRNNSGTIGNIGKSHG